MRVLVTTHGAAGHFHPLAPLARGLREAGHEVLFATEPPYVDAIVAVGFDAVPMGMDVDLHHPEDAFPPLKQLAGIEQAIWAIQNVFFGALPKAAFADATRLVAEWRPDVVLHELSEVAAMLAAEQVGIPHVAFHWTGAGVSMLALMIGDAWQELRDLAQLPPDPEMAALERYLTIAAMPSSWAGPVDDTRTLRIKLPLFDQTPDDVVPDWLGDLGPDPVVYGTLGTMFNDTPGVLQSLITAMGELDTDAIVTTGRNVGGLPPLDVPDNVRLERYVPQSWLLPRVAAVVHHAGFNTLLGSLNFGLPQVLIPLGADQPILAGRAVELGIGVAVDDPLSSAAITSATQQVLDDPSHRAAAQQMQADLEALPGIESAIAAIAALSQ